MKKSCLLALVLAAWGCGSDDDGFNSGDSTAYVVGTDFINAGVASRVSVPQLVVEQNTLAGVASTDPVVREASGRIFIINRFGFDNVTIIDGLNNVLIEQRSVGSGKNPQDVAVRGDMAYFPTLGGTGLVMLDLAAEGAAPVEIDLSSLDPEDGIPNCNSIVIVGERAIVGCQYRDDEDEFLSARGPGKVAVVNLNTNSLESDFDLIGTPTGRIMTLTNSGDILVPQVDPSFFDLTVGCVERLSLTGGALSSSGCAIENSSVGGYVASMQEAATGELYVAVISGFDADDFGPLGALVSLDGNLANPETMTDAAQRIFSVAVCPTGELVTADASGGLRVYSDGAEVTTELIDIGAPPVQDGIVCF